MEKEAKKPRGRKKKEVEPLDWDYIACFDVVAFFDGSLSFGKLGYGWHTTNPITREETFSNCHSIFQPDSSSNVAEYLGLIDLLSHLQQWYIDSNILIFGDSLLVINQMNKIWNINNGLYSPFATEAKNLLELSENRITLQHIKRELNERADILSKCY